MAAGPPVRRSVAGVDWERVALGLSLSLLGLLSQMPPTWGLGHGD